MNDSLLINKYKPENLNDFYGQDNTKDFLKNMIKLNIANFLLIGESGIGKTSYLNIYVKEYFFSRNINNYDNNILFINQSKEQGIHYFKNEIKLFCQTNSSKYSKKILIIDNLDFISESSQHIIRNFIDSYNSNILFIASATNQSKIITSLQSRLLTHFISFPKIDDFIKLSEKIIKFENIGIDNYALIKSIVLKSNFSFRKLINLLDKLSLIDKKITPSLANELCCQINDSIFKNIIDYLNVDDLKSSIKSIIDITNLGYSNIDIFDGFYEYIKKSNLDEDLKLKIIPIICKFISSYYIHFEDPLDLIFFVNKIYKILKCV